MTALERARGQQKGGSPKWPGPMQSFLGEATPWPRRSRTADHSDGDGGWRRETAGGGGAERRTRGLSRCPSRTEHDHAVCPAGPGPGGGRVGA